MSAGRVPPRTAIVAMLCVALGLALAWPAAQRPPARAIAIPAAVLAAAQSGDLVFRQGTDLVSDTVLFVDGGPYSHVGMLVRAPQGWQVIHAVPAEAPGQDDAVTIDALATFAAPARAHAIGIAHVEAEPAARANAIDQVRAQLGRPFGFAADQIYCTTLITAAWAQAGVPLAARPTRLRIPLMDGDYVLPSALLQSPRVRLVWSSAAPSPASGQIGNATGSPGASGDVHDPAISRHHARRPQQQARVRAIAAPCGDTGSKGTARRLSFAGRCRP